jgi:hypothetical protein
MEQQRVLDEANHQRALEEMKQVHEQTLNQLREEQKTELDRRAAETQKLIEDKLLAEATKSKKAMDDLKAQYEESERNLRNQVE